MGVTVRRSSSHLDRWDALPGETRWVDYSCLHADDELLVYVHTFRRVRERFDGSSDVLLWKPATTRLAHRYAEGEWDAVLRSEREWPPPELAHVARRRRGSALGRERP